ncbi:MAG: hypothetical protein EBU08_19945, partial [Micrococcales bacterium]|nr:hypothetical protein [Micrococcales bacterium]
MTEINFVDGQQLTPSSFGETDPQTGVWIPKVYTGSYGTNGFRLRFNNNSSTTALGYDTSGNGNNWTPNNFSVTPGSGNDSMLDVPSLYGTDTGLGGEVRGNYCTGNPLASDVSVGMTNGNLDWRVDNTRTSVGTLGMSSGKWYWEYTITAIVTNIRVGIVGSFRSFNTTYTSPSSYADGYSYISNGNKENNNSAVAYGATYTVNDIIGVVFDADAGTIAFYKNGVSQGTAYTGITGSFVGFAYGTGIGPTSCSLNFGQRPFAYTAPSGFKALCTTNLSAPAIGQTSDNQA